MKTTRSPLYSLVLRAAGTMGNGQRLADAIGVSLSAMLRGAKTGRLSTDTLLTIAEVAGENPGALLTAAGKGKTARRIQRLYGTSRAPRTEFDRRLLALPLETKRQMLRLVDALAAAERG